VLAACTSPPARRTPRTRSAFDHQDRGGWPGRASGKAGTALALEINGLVEQGCLGHQKRAAGPPSPHSTRNKVAAIDSKAPATSGRLGQERPARRAKRSASRASSPQGSRPSPRNPAPGSFTAQSRVTGRPRSASTKKPGKRRRASRQRSHRICHHRICQKHPHLQATPEGTAPQSSGCNGADAGSTLGSAAAGSVALRSSFRCIRAVIPTRRPLPTSASHFPDEVGAKTGSNEPAALHRLAWAARRTPRLERAGDHPFLPFDHGGILWCILSRRASFGVFHPCSGRVHGGLLSVSILTAMVRGQGGGPGKRRAGRSNS